MKFLLSVDLRDEGAPEAVTRAAAAWIKRLDAVVDLLFVDPFGSVMTPALSDVLREAVRREQAYQAGKDKEHLAALLEMLPAERRGRGLRLTGLPDVVIEAQAAKYDAVILGSGRTGMSRFLLGSVAAKVMRSCPVPIVLLHPDERPMGARPRLLTCVAMDGAQETVLAKSIGWAKALDAELHIAHVDESLDASWFFSDQAVREMVDAQWTRYRETQRGLVEQMAERIPEAHRGEAHPLTGTAHQEITQLAADYDAIIVATHGRTGLPLLFLGSVAEKIARSAPGPVIVLRLEPRTSEETTE